MIGDGYNFSRSVTIQPTLPLSVTVTAVLAYWFGIGRGKLYHMLPKKLHFNII